ncbi:fatty acid desaturase [Synechococcus sp. CB0205]|uniref:fatty acid desaturase n=1 Tax=Synechococcus sp. CB0205 TaxID=232363 RepID=UPI0002002D8B|nr:fatty acid desaturase [Synechococcus sp. CB0205]
MAAKPASPALIPPDQLAELNRRSNSAGWRRTISHAALIALSASVWLHTDLPLPLRLMALVLLGTGLAFCFCAMHECGHRTAFADRRLNDTVAWWAGVLSFYNADFYRRYHQWHHRYTHQPGLDPELEDPAPSTVPAYLLELSGVTWWIGKLRGHIRALLGNFSGCPYIPEEAAAQVTRSVRLQFGLYGLLLLASIPAGNGLLFWAWLLPLAVGQPLLRFVLLAEHGGCSFGDDGTRNTRTTLTLQPLRWLMWNMPFHAEHHLYASIPFHALPEAHRYVAPALQHLDQGYINVHRGLLRNLAALAA